MKRGKIWDINLYPTLGDEIKKTRPCIILSLDNLAKLQLRVIVPVIGWKETFEDCPWMVKIEPSDTNCLNKTKLL